MGQTSELDRGGKDEGLVQQHCGLGWGLQMEVSTQPKKRWLKIRSGGDETVNNNCEWETALGAHAHSRASEAPRRKAKPQKDVCVIDEAKREGYVLIILYLEI